MCRTGGLLPSWLLVLSFLLAAALLQASTVGDPPQLDVDSSQGLPSTPPPSAACAENEESSLLQSAGRRKQRFASAPPGFPEDEFFRSVDAVNQTAVAVMKALSLANTTVADMVTTVHSGSEKLTVALGLAKTGAESTRIIIGGKAADAVGKFIDDMLKSKEMLLSALKQRSAEMLNMADKLASNLSSRKESAIEALTVAEQKVQEAIRQNATSLLEVSNHGPIGWLRHVFGMDHSKHEPSPCEKAEDAIAAANSSVKELDRFMGELNATATSGLVTRMTSTFNKSFGELELSAKKAISGLGDSIPGTVKSAAQEAIEAFGSIAETVRRQVAPSEKKIVDFIREAEAPLTAVRNHCNRLKTELAKKC